MKFSYQQFEDEFVTSMEELEQAVRDQDHLKTIAYLKFLSRSYYEINYKFSDDRLEEILKQMSMSLLGETKILHSDEKTVAFYDSFGLAERGLSDVYVSGMAKSGYCVAWIMHCNAPDLEKIQQRYHGNEKISFHIIPKCPIVDRMWYLKSCMEKIAPRHVFYYGKPQDICGLGVIATITGDVTRYLVDLTDHAFWLGTCAVDYVIGFREYGYNVATQLRNIPSEKMIILPYYPQSRKEYPFEGMPFDVEQYEYVFSGGSPYKIEGDGENTYQSIVEYILTNYPKMKFVYAGNGSNHILEYLKVTYPEQFVHIAERRDLDEVLKRAKFYLGTYPLNGGLMVQYATQNRCIPISLIEEAGLPQDPRTWLLNPESIHFVFEKKEELLLVVDRLLTDPEYYQQMRAGLENQIITENEFINQLRHILEEKKTSFPKQTMTIRMERFLEIYRQRANYELFCKLIYNFGNVWVKKRYPEIVERMAAEKQRETL